MTPITFIFFNMGSIHVFFQIVYIVEAFVTARKFAWKSNFTRIVSSRVLFEQWLGGILFTTNTTYMFVFIFYMRLFVLIQSRMQKKTFMAYVAASSAFFHTMPYQMFIEHAFTGQCFITYVARMAFLRFGWCTALSLFYVIIKCFCCF